MPSLSVLSILHSGYVNFSIDQAVGEDDDRSCQNPDVFVFSCHPSWRTSQLS